MVGGYELDDPIGRGAQGSVWRAYRSGPVRQAVAVKRARAGASASAISRLRHEAAILAELDHPHIVRVLDVLDDDGDVAIVMQLARGGSLRDLLAERGTLTPGQTVAVLAPVAGALGSAHRRGVLHGDVKPANILFTSDGEPLLSDFGVARNLSCRDRPAPDVMGTAAYLDPEVLVSGESEPYNDVYAIAVIAYLALTGRLPHIGDDADALLAAADQGAHRSLFEDRSIPASLAAVVEAGLARDPDARPRTAEDLAHALRSAVTASAVDLPGTAVLAQTDELAQIDGLAHAGELAHPGERLPGTAVAADGLVHQTRPFGPRPPRPGGGGDEVAAAGRRWAAMVAVMVVAVGLLGFALARDSGRNEGGTPAAAADRSSRPSLRCPTLRTLAVPQGGSRLEADLRGDGCAVPVVWDGAIAQFLLSPEDASPRRYDFKKFLGAGQVRHEGGRLLIGDWDCDGVDSPALYDPATGIVHYFSAVPLQVGDDLSADREDRTDIEDGQAKVTIGSGPECDEVVVGRSA